MALMTLAEKLGALADVLDPPPDPWADNPVGWIADAMNRNDGWGGTWSKQQEICCSVRDHRFTAVRACHGPGKSFIAAWIVAWWLNTHDDAIVITSAPSQNQVKNILWKEIRRAARQADLGGYITASEIPEWKTDEGDVVAFGRKPADYKDPEQASTSFQGIHALHVLVILDEASGIPDWLANATETLVTNELSRVLLIGNPDNPTSYFARMNKPGSGYNVIRIRAWDTPAYTGEFVPDDVAAKLTSKLWVEERRRRWGEGSILWQSKVEAEFPAISEDTLFTPAIIAKGIETTIKPAGKGTAGMDVARLGQDETVVYLNQRGHTRLLARWSKYDTMETVGKFLDLFDHPDVPDSLPTTTIDITGGTGAGPYDRLRENGYPVVAFNSSEKANNPAKFLNRRAEAYWEAKELMEHGAVDIDVLDEDLQHELLAHKFKYGSTGRIQILSKEEVVKEIGHSPDRADAFVLALQKRISAGAYLPAQSHHVEPGPTADELVGDLMEIKL